MSDILLDENGDIFISESGVLQMTSDYQQVKQDVRIALNTQKRTFLSNPNIGFDKHNLLGRSLSEDLLDDIDNEISTAISSVYPYIIDVISYPISKNEIEAELTISYNGNVIPLGNKLVFNFFDGDVYFQDKDENKYVHDDSQNIKHNKEVTNKYLMRN
jgi:hypothetical protein